MLLVLVVLIPTILFSVLALDVLLTAERKAALRSMQELARASVNVMDREMTFATATAQTLSTSHVLLAGDFRQFYQQARAANNRPGIQAALLDETGQQLFNTVREYGSPIAPPGPVAQARIRSVLAGGVPVYSNLIKGSATGKFVVSVEQPVRLRDGRRIVVNEWMFAEHLNRLLPAQNVPASWLIAVFDKQGITIARNRHPEKFVGLPPRPERLRTILAGFEGVSRAYTRDGIEMYGAWERSELTGWTVGVGVPVAEIEKTAAQSVALLAAGFVIAILLAMGSALLFSRRLLKSIRHVSAAADLLPRYEIPPIIDLGVEEMNRLQRSLHDAGTLLAAAEQGRQEHLAEALRARQVAEEQNRSKDEFLAMLGHELRNPLAAVVSGATLLDQAAGDRTQVARIATIIGRQSRHLAKLVDDLLDAHRILSGKVTMQRVPLDLAKAVETCLAGFEARGAMQTHRIDADLVAVTIEGDPTRIEQMISNLVDNALKYTAQGGTVTLTVRREAAQAVLSIADNGIGMPPELLEKASDVFVQGQVVSRAKGGLGIGLAVVKSLAIQHGGTLEARSAGIGQGSVFTLRFPATTAAPATGASVACGMGAGSSVIVVEDNRDVREMMVLMLTTQGFSVQAAENGRRGLALARRVQPVVALIDIDMPDMSGHEVARQLKADPATASIRLIAVTGYGLPTEKADAVNAGFDRHLTKPVLLEHLTDCIRQLID
ncbi:hybrid sensor histidine kinase/response regulator [Pseudoduganella chitinolytica]|uniref:histidine kinase n=1 Tax=Pseudoduganella chitinolytica TaxID=34070 RepID=A0ABY8BE17_9BURK|nr:ATP-binding protein [Pseudoduganella chitinolytica]WEF33483.1 ATP-binding protein [Pseudoduganella chitinolytica]